MSCFSSWNTYLMVWRSNLEPSEKESQTLTILNPSCLEAPIARSLILRVPPPEPLLKVMIWPWSSPKTLSIPRSGAQCIIHCFFSHPKCPKGFRSGKETPPYKSKQFASCHSGRLTQKKTIVFQPSIFRCFFVLLVSGSGHYLPYPCDNFHLWSWMAPIYFKSRFHCAGSCVWIDKVGSIQ